MVRPEASHHASASLSMQPTATRFFYPDVALGAVVAEIPSLERTTASIEAELGPLYRKLGLRTGWVEAVTGIAARREWAPGEHYTEAAVRAARRALTDAGLTGGSVGALICTSVYRHRLEPTIASEIQGELGLGRGCANFDVANACLGFMTGLVTAANMVALGQVEHALVVASEDSRPVTQATLESLRRPGASIQSFRDQLATLTLGSAAAAAVVTRATHTGGRRRLRGGAACAAAEHHGLCKGDASGMHTDSVALLREGVSLAHATWKTTQDVLGWSPHSASTYCLHQVGRAHTDTLLSQLGLPSESAPRLFPWLGNVGSVGVPITLALSAEQGLLAQGQSVALMGIGSGLNCMMLGVEW